MGYKVVSVRTADRLFSSAGFHEYKVGLITKIGDCGSVFMDINKAHWYCREAQPVVYNPLVIFKCLIWNYAIHTSDYNLSPFYIAKDIMLLGEPIDIP